MPSRKTQRKDDDLVPKIDKLEPLPKGSKKTELPELDLLPEWNPLPIGNESEYGQPNSLSGINNARSIKLFQLFFTEEWMENIIEYTNANAERI